MMDLSIFNELQENMLTIAHILPKKNKRPQNRMGSQISEEMG